MVRNLVIVASGFASARRPYPDSGLWESTVDSYYRIILTPPGSGGSVTHVAHRDNQYCPHTQLVRFPLVTFVFVRYYTLDDDGMLRRASPDLASVSGLWFRELPRGAGPGIFAQIADGGFVMFGARALHARGQARRRAGAGHLSHQRRRPPDVAAGVAISGGLLRVLFFFITPPGPSAQNPHGVEVGDSLPQCKKWQTSAQRAVHFASLGFAFGGADAGFVCAPCAGLSWLSRRARRRR